MSTQMTAGQSWRTTVTQRPLVGALVAGFIATHLATVMGYWFHGLKFIIGDNPKLGTLDLGWPTFNGLLLLPKESVTSQFWAGAIFHFMTGIAFSLAYCLLIFPLFKWKNSVGGNIGKAMVYGFVLATLSALWWVPQLFPAFNPGFFSWNLGWRAVFGIYLWHAIYAVNLGAFYSPLPRSEQG